MPAATTFDLDLIANFHSVSIALGFTEDAGWAANTITVSGQVQVNQQWFELHDLLLDARGDDTYWGRIFGLQEGVTYSVRIRWLKIQNSNGDILEDITTTGSVTTRTSPASGSGAALYISPTGDDNTGDGSRGTPYKSPVKAASVLASGGTIVMLNDVYGPGASDGSYDFGDATWQITNVDGSGSAYKTIRPDTPSGVLISGASPINGLSWTKHATRVYYADYSSFMKTSATKQAPRWVRRVSTGNILYIYNGLDADSTDNVGINSGTMTAEGFCIDWTNNRIYIRLDPADADAAPADGMYEASARTRTLRFSGSDFWIVDGLRFEMFGEIYHNGSQYVSGSTDSSLATFALRLSNADDVVIRNCTLQSCAIRLDGTPPTRVTIEDCTISLCDVLAKLLTSPWNSTKWGRGHNTSNFSIGILADQAGDGLVVRRCVISACDTAISLNGGDGTQWTRHCDIYENAFSQISDDTIEVDCTFADDGAGKNLAVWHNTFTYTNNTISLSPFSPGPVWYIGNYGTECGLFYHFKVGEAVSGDGSTDSFGHKLFYNNTLYTSFLSTNAADCFHFNTGAGNIRAINNILRGSGSKYISDGANDDYQEPNTFTTNAFYLPSPSSPWTYHGTGYATEALYTAAAGSDFVLSGNLYGIDPFPDGLTGLIDVRLRRIATRIKGISMIAADANGNRLGEPGHLGYFENFRYPPTPDTTLEAPGDVLGLRWRPHWRQNQLA